MTSNNRVLLTLGVAGLVLFSVVGRSMKMVRDRERKQIKKDLTTWEGEGGNPLPGASASTNPADNPAVPPTSH